MLPSAFRSLRAIQERENESRITTTWAASEGVTARRYPIVLDCFLLLCCFNHEEGEQGTSTGCFHCFFCISIEFNRSVSSTINVPMCCYHHSYTTVVRAMPLRFPPPPYDTQQFHEFSGPPKPHALLQTPSQTTYASMTRETPARNQSMDGNIAPAHRWLDAFASHNTLPLRETCNACRHKPRPCLGTRTCPKSACCRRKIVRLMASGLSGRNSAAGAPTTRSRRE